MLVPPANIQKNVQFRAAYTDGTFNQQMLSLVRQDGVLAGLQVALLSSTQLSVTLGAFIQQGLIVEMTADLILPAPVVSLPWTVYAYSDDSQNTSPVNIAVATTGTQPPGVVVLATSSDGVLFAMSHQLSISSIRRELDALEADEKARTNLLINPGFELINVKKGVGFTMQGPCMDGWQADNLSNRAAASRVDIITDPAETLQGGTAVKLTSQSYSDPGGTLPDGSTYPAAVYSTARIYQSLDGYQEYVGEDITFSVFLKLPISQANQLHDLEIGIYGSNLGTPGFSDTPVDHFTYVIPSYTLTHSWQQFTVTAKIEHLNAGLAAYPLPAFPGISVRIAFVNREPAGSPITTDKVMIDDGMLYLGDIGFPIFAPVQRDLDWLLAEGLFEAALLEEVRIAGATDLQYIMGVSERFRSKKQGIPSVSFDLLVLSEEGAPFSVNSQANYDKIIEATSLEEFRLQAAKLISGYRPGRIKAVVRAQG